MADYESKVHNIYSSLYYKATDKLSLHGTVMFNKAEGALEQVNMPDPHDNGQVPHEALENQDFDFTGLNTYSDLNYELLQFKGGFKYYLTPDMALTADGLYADLKDNEGYVYGDESGSFFMIRTGIKVTF